MHLEPIVDAAVYQVMLVVAGRERDTEKTRRVFWWNYQREPDLFRLAARLWLDCRLPASQSIVPHVDAFRERSNSDSHDAMTAKFDKGLSPTGSSSVRSMNRVLTVRELAGYLKVHPTTIYRLLKRGAVPAFRVGSDWRFNIESIDKWRHKQETVQRPAAKAVRVESGR